ncbi:MAG TPA: tetratricopeptide repeat protein [Bacteroidota bacterium]|nr:tetratricopeptide repeat protein [Bacteroidota bacterium]
MKLRISIVFVGLLNILTAVSAQDTKENADFKLAVNLYNDKLYDLALEQFRQFINLYPNTANGIEARFYLGLTQAKLTKHDDARLTFQNFALAFPDHPKAPDAWWNVGEAYVAMKNVREAALAFERVRTFHPKSKLAPAALARASELFEEAGETETAKRILRTLTQEYSSADVLHPARLRLARHFVTEGQLELARIELKKVVDGAKDSAFRGSALLELAKVQLAQGKIDEAQTFLQDLTQNYRNTPHYYPALLLLGNVYKQIGNSGEAIKTWTNIADDSLRAPPGIRQNALLELGDLNASRRDYTTALRFYDRASLLHGDRTGEAFYKAGVSAEKTKLLTRASDYYAKAVQDSGGTIDRRAVLIAAFRGALMAKNYYEALRVADEYKKKYSGDEHLPRLLFEAGIVHLQHLKNPRTALELFDEVITHHGSHPYADDAAYGAALAYHEWGRFEEAIEAYRELERRFPASEFIQEANRRIRRIQLFEMKNKEAGLEKLALLIGDVIAQRSKGDLAFRLGEIYFHDLHDYDNAARQYTIALESGLDETLKQSALLNRAKSYDYLAWRDMIEGRSSQFTQRAIAAYDSVVAKYPLGEARLEAAAESFRLRIQNATNAAELRKMQDEIEKSSLPLSKRFDLLLHVGAQLRDQKNFEGALSAFRIANKLTPEGNAEALFRLGKTLTEMGDRDTSIAILSDYVTRFPHHHRAPEALKILAESYAAAGKVELAIGALQTIEKTFSYTRFSDDLHLLRAQTYVAANDYQKALAEYEKHIRQVRQDYFDLREISIDLLMQMASLYEQAGLRREAQRYCALVLEKNPPAVQAAQIYYSLASIAREDRNLELAARYLQEANRLAPASGEQYNRAALEAAELLFRTEDYTTALTRYTEVAQRVVGDSLQQYLQSRIIVCYFRLDNLKEADRRANTFVRTYPKAENYAAEFEYERGRYHLRRDEVEVAVKRFENVLTRYGKSPIAPETIYWLARAHELGMRPQRAVALYDSLLQRFPNHEIVPRAQLSLGNVYYNLEQWDAAARLYKAILDNERRSPDLVQYAMSNLIMAYKEMTLFDAALDLTRKYIERFPEDPELVNKKVDIGVLFQKLGYHDQSIFHLQSLLEGADADLEAEVRYYIGEAYFYKGDYQQAILEFLKVPYLVTRRTKVDWTATSYYMAGQSYEKMSKFDQAISMYKQIIERPGIDQQFKIAAQKEIDRVNLLVKSR